jgi:hypothetical protein
MHLIITSSLRLAQHCNAQFLDYRKLNIFKEMVEFDSLDDHQDEYDMLKNEEACFVAKSNEDEEELPKRSIGSINNLPT